MIINILLKAELERERKGKAEERRGEREEGFTLEVSMENRLKKNWFAKVFRGQTSVNPKGSLKF